MTKTVSLAITRKAVEKSPDANTRRPVSRQQEAATLAYYGHPYYWHGSGLWGAGGYPTGLPVPGIEEARAQVEADREAAQARGDEHLRSSKEVIRCQSI
jgi:hypothetical protein